MSNDDSDKFLFDPAAIRKEITESKKKDSLYIPYNDALIVRSEKIEKMRKFGPLAIQPNLWDIYNLKSTHAIFFLKNIDLPQNNLKIDDALSFHRWPFSETRLSDWEKNNEPDMQFACIKIDDATQFFPKDYVEKYSGNSKILQDKYNMESISQDSYNMANALMRLRIFFTSCNLSINTQFGSPSIVVTHLPWQKVSLLNPNDLENLFQYLTDRKFNLGLGLSEKDFFKNEQVKTLVSNSLILKELYNSAQITNIGLSSITDRVYYNYSSIPSFNHPNEKTIKSSTDLYKKILNVLKNETPKNKTKLILYFWNFQSAIEESHTHQGLNIMLLENCLERLFTKDLNAMNKYTKFHTQAISHYILDESAPNLLPLMGFLLNVPVLDDEAVKKHLIKLISNLRNNIAHGKFIPDAYAGIAIDENFIELKIITKFILYYIVKRLTSEEISLDVLIEELENKAKMKYPKEWAPDIKND